MTDYEYFLLPLNDMEFNKTTNNNNNNYNNIEVNISKNMNNNIEIINDFGNNELDNSNNDMYNGNIERNSKAKQSRVYWVDCLRIFSSILVVYIHVSFINTERGSIFSHNWNGLFLHNSIPRHCVPLFVMISGIFFLNPDKKITLKKLYMKNIFHMVKSYLFWSSYYAIINKYVVNLYHTKYTLNMSLIGQTIYDIILASDHLWYLPFVIGLYIMTPIYRSIVKERPTAWYIVIISMFLSQFLPTLISIFVNILNININMVIDFFKNFKIELVGSFSVYYILGHLLYTHNFNNKKKYFFLWYVIGIVCLMITVILRFLEVYNKKDEEDNDFGKYNNFFVALTAISTFIFFKYNVSKWIDPLMKNEIIKKIVLKLSECSFGIYLVHMTVYDILHRFNFHSVTLDPYYWIPFYSMIVYIICFLLIYLLRKIELFKLVT